MENLKRSETLTLLLPMELADKTLTEITMRRPTMKDIRKFPVKNSNDTEGEFRQFAALCNLRVEEMEAIDSADYARLQDLYTRFRTPPKLDGDKGSDAGAEPDDALGSE